MMENNKPKIIHHRNEWCWGKSTICITNDGYGTGTVSFVTEYEYNEETDGFIPVKQAVISGISVHHSHRKQGYGNFVLSECETEAAKNGYNEVYLWAEPESEAYKWYKRHGYEETEQMSIVPTGDKTNEQGAANANTEALYRLKKVFPKIEELENLTIFNSPFNN